MREMYTEFENKQLITNESKSSSAVLVKNKVNILIIRKTLDQYHFYINGLKVFSADLSQFGDHGDYFGFVVYKDQVVEADFLRIQYLDDTAEPKYLTGNSKPSDFFSTSFE